MLRVPACSLRTVLPLCCLLLTTACLHAQGPEAICIGLRLGIPGARGIRGYGMGNTIVASTGQPHNPAMLGVPERRVMLMLGSTSFAGGSDVTSSWIAAQTPLSPREGLRVLYAHVESGWDPTNWVPVPGARMRITGSHLALDYSNALSDRLRVGVAITPVLDTEITLRMDGAATLARVSGVVIPRGGRVGVDYDLRDDLRIAAQYDYCDIDATATNVMTNDSSRADMRLRDFIVGAEWQPIEATTLALELEAGRASGAGYRNSIDAISGGVEYRLQDGLALRGGIADGQATFGAGWAADDVRIGAAYVSDQYGDEVGAAMGGSEAWYLSADLSW